MPFDHNRLWTASLRAAPWGAVATKLMAAALSAVEPAAAVRAALRRTGNTMVAGATAYDLATIQRVFLVGVGKAGRPMAVAAAAILGPQLHAGVVVVKDDGDDNAETPDPRIELLHARHPLPDERGVAGAQRIAALLADAGEADLVLALISGGGSALLTLPASGLSLGDLQALTAQLLACGASIDEINSLRKHLDLVKGGGLARMAYPATLLTLLLSDVVGNPIDVIASGPTVPDSSHFADAWAVLERHSLLNAAPAAVLAHLRHGIAGTIPETPKADDHCFARTAHMLVGSNQQAAEAAETAARAAGFHSAILTTFMQGEARETGRFLGTIARELATNGRPLPRPACLIVGGETTVTLRGNGRGGRNQELALAAVAELDGLPNSAIITLATDGGDGPTDAAGAVVTGETAARARAYGLDPADYLARNDAYAFFDAIGDLLRPGSTQTNVNDLVFLFAW